MAEKQHVVAGKRLIVALDVAALKEAQAIVSELDGLVSFFKIGLWMHVLPGIADLAAELVSSGKQVFWDVKGHDIPETLRGYTAAAGRAGFSFLTIHSSGEVTDEAIRFAIDGKKGTGLKILAVTALTSMSDDEARSLYGVNSASALVAERARRAIALGLDGVIASAREAAMIRKLAAERDRQDFLIVTPGIRPSGSTADDQKRITRPSEAINNGADYLVVGRPILQAHDRRRAARAIIDEMQRAFDQR